MKAKLFLIAAFSSAIFIFTSCSRNGLIDQEEIPSENDQTILDNLRIISPSAGVTWKPGSVQKIIWSFPDVVKKVQIRLYRKQELRSILALDYENTGLFVWQIPDDIMNSVHYRIQIFDVNAPVLTKTTEYFFIKF